MRRLFLAALVLIYPLVCSGDAPLPKGWRFATPNELQDPERSDSKNKYTIATGDFNGDGLEDRAYVLKSTRFSGEALWVRISRKGAEPEWVLLHKIDWGPKYPSVDLAMGVKTLPPGTYPYACDQSEKGCDIYNEDPAKQPRKIVRTSAIMYFKPGSSASLFFWDRQRKKFQQIWISD